MRFIAVIVRFIIYLRWEMPESSKSKKLWNKDFFLLWQGQLIAELGNAAFTAVLGFWVLDMTESKALMGLILACFALPRVLFGPFAGAFADRANKKLIIIFSDLMRGLFFLAMGLVFITKVFPFGIIYPFALFISFFGSFFNPAINSAIPEIVSKENLTKANSARGVSQTLSSLVGLALGGLIYSLIQTPIYMKGPVFFVFTGFTYVYEAISQIFIKMPHVKNTNVEEKHILKEMVIGFQYSWRNTGIKILLITGMFISFFVTVGVTLLQPLFRDTPGFGTARYGFTMGLLMAGSITGMLILSLFKLKSRSRFFYYRLATFLMIGCMLVGGTTHSFAVITVLVFIAGLCNSFVAVFTQTVLHITVPQDTRGKVFGIKDAMIDALAPFAMALSGIAAEFLSVRPTIIGAFSLAAVAVLPSLFSKTFCGYMNSEETIHHLENV